MKDNKTRKMALSRENGKYYLHIMGLEQQEHYEIDRTLAAELSVSNDWFAWFEKTINVALAQLKPEHFVEDAESTLNVYFGDAVAFLPEFRTGFSSLNAKVKPHLKNDNRSLKTIALFLKHRTDLEEFIFNQWLIVKDFYLKRRIFKNYLPVDDAYLKLSLGEDNLMHQKLTLVSPTQGPHRSITNNRPISPETIFVTQLEESAFLERSVKSLVSSDFESTLIRRKEFLRWNGLRVAWHGNKHITLSQKFVAYQKYRGQAKAVNNAMIKRWKRIADLKGVDETLALNLLFYLHHRGVLKTPDDAKLILKGIKAHLKNVA